MSICSTAEASGMHNSVYAGKTYSNIVRQTTKGHSPMSDLTPRAAAWHPPHMSPLALYFSGLSNPDRFLAFINETKLLRRELIRGSIYGPLVSQQDV